VTRSGHCVAPITESFRAVSGVAGNGHSFGAAGDVGLAEDDRHMIAAVLAASATAAAPWTMRRESSHELSKSLAILESAEQRKLARNNPNLAVLKLNQRSNGGDEAAEREGGPCDDKQDAEHQC
jgi:hypothetical protein